MSAGAGSVDRKGSLRAGIAVERWSIAWMAVEAAAALTAALQAGSVVLGAFGADSLIELAAALVLLRRLQAERRGQDAEGLERRAGRIVGALLLALAALVVAAAGRDLILRTQPGATALGLAIAAASTAIMPWIVATKRRPRGHRDRQPRTAGRRRLRHHLRLHGRHRPGRPRPAGGLRLVVGRPGRGPRPRVLPGARGA